MIFDPSAPPFWAATRTDPARAAWQADRTAFQRLARLTRRLHALDPEDAKSVRLSDERRQLEVRLGVSCTRLATVADLISPARCGYRGPPAAPAPARTREGKRDA